MQKNTVIAVVVTYNRLELLKDLINSLRSQTFKISQILVVNNGSTDNSKVWLDSQADLKVIHQSNTGSSGGQYTSIKSAMEFDYEWVWIMDDDILHEANTLQNLMKYANKECVLTTLRYDNKGQVFQNDTINYNLNNPLKSFWGQIVTNHFLENHKEELIKADGITFEGPLVHRNIIDKVGLPIHDFFIYGDDTEYFIRIAKSKSPIYIVKNAKTTRRLDYTLDQRDLNGKLIFNWKHYYIIRNLIIINRIHGNILVKLFRPFIYLFLWHQRAGNSNDKKTVLKAFKDALNFKS